MHATLLAVLLQSVFALMVQATLYVVNPRAGSTCSGGKPCTVDWLDDGTVPLLSQIGPCHVALYNGDHVLVQQIDPVDVSSTHSLTFTPDSKAGPNSDSYYVNFTSVNLVGNPPAHYSQFSASFTLDSMSGNLASPVASDTSTIAVPASILSPSPDPILSTTTIGSASGSAAPQSSSTGSPSASGSASQSASSSASPASSATIQSSSGSAASSSSAPTSTQSASGTSSDSQPPATSDASSTSASSSGSSSATATVQSSSTDIQPTTLTVLPTASGFSTARPSSTAPAFSDSDSPSTPLSSGVAQGGSSTSGCMRSVEGASIFAMATLSFAVVFSAAVLL